MGFSDFAGSTWVHSVGGWAALAGAILLGSRDGKYSADGKVNVIPGCSLPMTTLVCSSCGSVGLVLTEGLN